MRPFAATPRTAWIDPQPLRALILKATLLGQFLIRVDDETVELSSRPAQLLLAYLLLYPGVTHRRDQLAGLLWPGYLDRSARINLRNTIWQVRRALGPQFLF